MSEVLSQSEIDELLSALSSGTLLPQDETENKEKQQIKAYNFRSPKKFSKEQIRTMEMIYESYARLISSYLTAQIRTNVQIKVAIIEQVTYEEFIKSVSTPTILAVYKMPPLGGSLLLEMNPQFVFQIIDILFGGPGTTAFKAREFTDIEKNVIKSVIIKLIENLKLAWEDVIDVEPQFDSIETNPALNQTMAPNEPVLLMSMSTRINEVQTYINFCIPYIAIENVIDKLVVKYWSQQTNPASDKIVKNAIEKKLLNVSLEMTAVLGKTIIPVKSFMDLQLGDVIQLDRNVQTPLDVLIGEKKQYSVQPGTFSKKRAVRVVEIIDKDVENYE